MSPLIDLWFEKEVFVRIHGSAGVAEHVEDSPGVVEVVIKSVSEDDDDVIIDDG